ncbi:TPA: helix-turn-helix transcriptional regulator [Enterococcus faecalis]
MENLLQSERKKKNISRKELALLVGCPESVIRDIELKKIVPSVQLMKGIAFALQNTPEQIFNINF